MFRAGKGKLSLFKEASSTKPSNAISWNCLAPSTGHIVSTRKFKQKEKPPELFRFVDQLRNIKKKGKKVLILAGGMKN